MKFCNGFNPSKKNEFVHKTFSLSSKTFAFSCKVLKYSSWSYLIFPSQKFCERTQSLSGDAKHFCKHKVCWWNVNILWKQQKHWNIIFRRFEMSAHFISPSPYPFRVSVDCAFRYVVPSASLITFHHIWIHSVQKKNQQIPSGLHHDSLNIQILVIQHRKENIFWLTWWKRIIWDGKCSMKTWKTRGHKNGHAILYTWTSHLNQATNKLSCWWFKRFDTGAQGSPGTLDVKAQKWAALHPSQLHKVTNINHHSTLSHNKLSATS